jgi:dienelactone hydrolase
VLLLHGGQEHSRAPTALTQPSVLRLWDIYTGLRASSRRAAIYLLRYGVRGWNADQSGHPEPAPVADARHAMDHISAAHPGAPLVLLGYSMGGRVAFSVAQDPRVQGICALAPWLPDDEPLHTRHDSQRFVLAHGTADRMTSAAASLRYAERLRAVGEAVARFELAGERHALMSRPLMWHRFAVRVTLGLAGDRPLPARVATALESTEAQTLRLPLERSSYR